MEKKHVNNQNNKIAHQEILKACQRQFLDENGKPDYQKGISILKKYYGGESPKLNINAPLLETHEWPPIFYCTFSGNIEETKTLLSLGAKADYKISGGFTPLHLASALNSPSLCFYYLKGGVDVDIETNNKKTPMMEACENGSMKSVEVLIQKNPDILKESLDKLTCLDYAMEKKHYNIVRYIQYCNLNGNLKKQDEKKGTVKI